MKLLRWLPVWLVLVLVLLLATVPARIIGYIAPPNQVALAGFAGTLWNGKVASAAVATTAGMLQLGEVRWRLRPLSLLWLSPEVALVTEWGQQRLEGRISIGLTGNITLRDASISVPAELARLLAPVQLHGALNLFTEELILADGQLQSGAGRLVWQQAAWSGNRTRQALGDYALQFDVLAPGEVDGTILTLAGPVRVEGSARLFPERYTVDAQLSSDGELSRELSNALRLFATPTSSGFNIKMDTPLNP